MGCTYRLDGASYGVVSDSEAQIRPNTRLTMFYIACISLLIAGLLALIVSNILAGFMGSQPLNVLGLCMYTMVIGILAFIMYHVFVESRRPPITISRDTRRIEIGLGSDKRTVDFDKVNYVGTEYKKTTQVSSRTPRNAAPSATLEIYLKLIGGESVVIGTVSGKLSKLQGRADQIAQSVAAFISADLAATRGAAKIPFSATIRAKEKIPGHTRGKVVVAWDAQEPFIYIATNHGAVDLEEGDLAQIVDIVAMNILWIKKSE